MSIEKINAAQQVVNTPNNDLPREEAKTQVQSKGSTKDIVAALGILASIGIATVAIIKSKNAAKELQEALKKAEEEKKKLAEEARKAAEEAKKKVEEINKKIDEAVNKTKSEIRNSLHTNGTYNNGAVDTASIEKGLQDILKKIEEEKVRLIEESKNSSVDIDKKIEEAVNRIKDELKNSKPKARNKKQSKVIEQKPETPKVEDIKPETGTVPESPVIPKTEDIKPETNNVSEIVETPKVENKKPEAKNTPTTVEKPKVEDKKPEITNAPEVPAAPKAGEVKPTEPTPAQITDKPQTAVTQEEKITKAESQEMDMAQVAKNILNQKPELQPIDVLGKIDLSKPLSRMTEKELLVEYNALKDVVKDLSAGSPAARRFLEVKGELVNKRAFRVTKDGIEKRPGILDEYTKQGLEYIEKEEAAAQRAVEESNARNEEWLEQQRALKQEEYEAMFENLQREQDIANGAKELEMHILDTELKEIDTETLPKVLQEAQNGIIVIPRATKLSNYLSKQFGNLKSKLGSLFGKKKPVTEEPKPFEPSAEGVNAWIETLKEKETEYSKQVKEQVRQQLQDNSNTVPVQEFIDSNITRKNNTRYHNKIQKQYDKMAEELKGQEAVEVAKTETPKIEAQAAEKSAQEAAKVINKEFNGLSEVDSLLVEREALKKSSESFNAARLEEIDTRLAELGAKDLKVDLKSEVASANYTITYNKSEIAYWQREIRKEESKCETTIKKMQEKGVQPLNFSKEEKVQIADFIQKTKTYLRWAEEDPKYAQDALKQANEIQRNLKKLGKEISMPVTEEAKLQYNLIIAEANLSKYRIFVKIRMAKVRNNHEKRSIFNIK